jgi:hypothetical protein
MTAAQARILRIGGGILAANVFGLVACALFVLVVLWSNQPGSDPAARYVLAVGYPSLALVPIGMGMVAAFFWRKAGLNIPEYLLWWTATTLVVPIGGYGLLREGLVCLLIAAPILFVFGVAGVFIGRICFKPRWTTLNLTILPLLLLVILGEGKLRTDTRAVVADRLVINANAAEVWKHVVEFPPIPAAPDHWLNRVGLPSPSATTSEGEFVGAHRRCIFSNGLAFEERVAEIVREKLLTFDIVEQPRDPELLGHLDLHRGQFELQDNGDGTTTLIGRSWYTLHVRPLWYFDWWTRDITSHVHLRVMRHIKNLSEQHL